MIRRKPLGLRGRLALLALITIPAGTVSAETENPSRVVDVGIRAEARPFAYFDAQTQTFEGLLVDLCFEAVLKAGFQLNKHKMTAADRELLLSGDAGELSSGAQDLDLMCDPTTLTLRRLDLMAAQAELAEEGGTTRDFSPIVFLANGSYIERRPTKKEEEQIAEEKALAEQAAEALAEAIELETEGDSASVAQTMEDLTVEETNSILVGVSKHRPDNAQRDCVVGPGQTLQDVERYQFAGVVQTTTATDTLVYAVRKGLLVLSEKTAICAVPFKDHVQLITAFCRGDLAFYFGDLDIMRSYHRWYLDTVGLKAEAACPMRAADRPVSYEPYAFIVSSRVPGFRQKFNRALYAIFHDGKTVGQMSLHFGENKTLSPFVQTLFRINNVPSGYPPLYPDTPQ